MPRNERNASVAFEVCFAPKTAAYARFGRAVVECGARLTDSYTFLQGTVVTMVWLKLDKVDQFRETAKPWTMKYYPPRLFDNGTLVAKYASPEDELAGKLTPGAERIEVDRACDNHVLDAAEAGENPWASK